MAFTLAIADALRLLVWKIEYRLGPHAALVIAASQLLNELLGDMVNCGKTVVLVTSGKAEIFSSSPEVIAEATLAGLNSLAHEVQSVSGLMRSMFLSLHSHAEMQGLFSLREEHPDVPFRVWVVEDAMPDGKKEVTEAIDELCAKAEWVERVNDGHSTACLADELRRVSAA